MVSGIVGVSLLVVVGTGTSEEGGGGDERGLHYVELKNTRGVLFCLVVVVAYVFTVGCRPLGSRITNAR